MKNQGIKKIINNKQGTGFLQVLMAAAMTGVLSLNIATMVKNGNNDTQAIITKTEMMSEKNLLSMILSNPNTCSGLLKDSLDNQARYIASNSTSVPASSAINNMVRLETPAGKIYEAGQDNVTWKINQFSFRNDATHIEAHPTIADAETYVTELVMQTERKHEGAGAKIRNMKMAIKITSDTTDGSIISCESMHTNARAMEEMCAAMEGSWDASAQVCEKPTVEIMTAAQANAAVLAGTIDDGDIIYVETP